MKLPPPSPSEKISHLASGPAIFSPTGTSAAAPSSTPSTSQGVHSKRGTIELQPGILQTQDPFQNDQGETIPSNFRIDNGPIGDATPMLRYLLTVEGVTPVTKKRKSDSLDHGISPTNGRGTNNNYNNGADGVNHDNNNNNNKHLSGKAYLQPLTVNFCSFDGSLKISTKLQHGYSCPFESCGLRCRESIGALQQHMLASHPYYEYFVTNSDDQGTELWVRCKKEWFGVNGAFLPASGVAIAMNRINKNTTRDGNNGNVAEAVATDGSHPLAPLIYRTPNTLPFQYICRKEQRMYRRNEGGTYPIDLAEERLEENAAVLAEDGNANGLFIWDSADLAPIEPEIEEGRTGNSELEDNSAAGNNNNSRCGGRWGNTIAAGPSTGRPPRPSPLHRRSGSLHLSNQHSLLPTKLPLTDRNGLPKFYHRGRCIAMTEQELEVEAADSDDDSDTEQYIRYYSTALEEKPNLCREEIDFMLTWNVYTLRNPIHADSAVPATCIAFAKDHLERLQDAKGSFRRCFVAQVLNLWKFRLLTPAQIHEALLAAGGGGDGRVQGGGGGEGGSAEPIEVDLSAEF